MNEEVFDCVYNLWTGFVGEATCEAGFLKCDEMSCPAYTRRPKKKPQTNADKIRAASDETLARFIIHLFVSILDHGVEPKINYTLDDGMEKNLLNWLKSPVDKDGEG